MCRRWIAMAGVAMLLPLGRGFAQTPAAQPATTFQMNGVEAPVPEAPVEATPAVVQAPVVAAPEQAARPVLVELFTSEGCSSCPPADDILSKLQGVQTEAGQMVVALSEHVTYWNQQGWADPFSKEIFSARQNAYGERFNLEDVYTPQVVVNGNQQVLGNDGNAVRKAVLAEIFRWPEMLKIISVEPAPSVRKSEALLAVTFVLESPLPAGAEVYAVVADDMDFSQVLRGENAGRSLAHVAVARNLMQVVRPDASGPTTVTVSTGGTANQAQHIVLFVQEQGQGSVVSIATAAVPAAGLAQNAALQ